MNAQNFMLNLVGQVSQTAFIEDVPKKVSEEDSKAFRKMLDSSMKKSSSEFEGRQFVSSNESKWKNFDNKNKLKTANDMEQGNTGTSQSTATNKNNAVVKQSKKSSGDCAESARETETKLKEDIVLECLAQILGIDSSQLMNMVEELDIDLQQLIDRPETIFGMDLQQEQVLQVLIQEISSQVENVLKTAGSVGETIQNMQQMVKTEGIVAEIVDKVKEKLELTDMINSFKFDQMKLKIQQAIQSKDTDSEVLNPVESGEKTENDVLSVNSDSKANDDNIVNTDYNQNSDENGNSSLMSGEQQTEQTQEFGLKTEHGEIGVQFSNVMSENSSKIDSQVGTVKFSAENFVSKEDVINQVINKAKVLLGEDKSEMLIDLKPEHLGKLSLKVVTEHGIVAAKIVAENQQVKQILESNMQILKDALEKQGMTVQGFSVSVRQDSSDSSAQHGWNSGKGRQKTQKTVYNSTAVNMEGIQSVRYGTDNLYNWGESSINLTA